MPEARWSTIINTLAPGLNVALDTALHSIASNSKPLKGCFVEGTFTARNLAPNDIKKLIDEVNKNGWPYPVPEEPSPCPLAPLL